MRTPLVPVVTLATAVCAVALGGCAGARPHLADPSRTPGAATMVRDVDGDTVRVQLRGRTEAVRLLGIDTPESVRPNTPVECFAHEAAARTAALLPPGTPLRLEGDVEARDRYGRVLAYVYRAADGLFVNLQLAREGVAAPYTFPPDVAHADELVAAAQAARSARRGLWGRCSGPHQPASEPGGGG